MFATRLSLYVPITCNLSSYLPISLGGQIADEMRHLESYFFDEFKRGRRMVELYELVQVISPHLLSAGPRMSLTNRHLLGTPGTET